MEIIRCGMGHSYDPSITPECPECAKLRGGTVALERMSELYYGNEDYGKTEPVNFDSGKTERIYQPTERVNRSAPVHWADVNDYREADMAAESYSPTMPINMGRREENARKRLPVTGWLVCVEGACVGEDYRIHAEYNYIGRSPKMDICIQGDPTVSRERHAIIAYDSRDGIFYFAASGGGSMVRLNDKAVLGNVELKAYDRLTIGQSIFLFIPLCGEQFKWSN